MSTLYHPTLPLTGVRPAQLAQPARASRSCRSWGRSFRIAAQQLASAAGGNAVGLQTHDAKAAALPARPVYQDPEVQYLTTRSNHVTRHFPSALGVDDLMQRLEVGLFEHGFTNGNSIACINLCRDEVTQTLKHKIDQVFGSSFSTHGLGGVYTCGVTGMGAGLSHSPVCESSGKERYVFFSFPHIAIDSKGAVGNISRPGRPGVSCACGALIKALGELKRDGLASSWKPPGVHQPLDVEYSVLKNRLARRLEAEGATDEQVAGLDLVQLTKLADRMCKTDLEFLISRTVDITKADYAVVCGVQVHNWGTDFDGEEPNLEFVAVSSAYVVVDGERKNLNLSAVPALTPRQIRILASAPDAHAMASPAASESAVCNSGGGSTLREIDPPYMFASKEARQRSRERMASFAKLLEEGPGVRAALPAAAASPEAAPAQQQQHEQAAAKAAALQHPAEVQQAQQAEQAAAAYHAPAANGEHWTEQDEVMFKGWSEFARTGGRSQ